MLTAMKLKGKARDIAVYHSREENYYYTQAKELTKLSDDIGSKILIDDKLEYVQAHGKLCSSLGLKSGESIDEMTFVKLLESKDVEGSQKLKKHKVHGVDLTFSTPKSVSIAGLLTDKNPDIIKAHDYAVLDVMSEVENLAHGRLNKNEKIHTGKMCYVTARDGFSREHDPHLHTHVIVMNMTQHKNDKYASLDMQKVFNQEFNKLYGTLYRIKLAHRLKELGYSISYTSAGQWRLDKVSHELESQFSKRTKQINGAEMEAQLDIDAWRKTRKEKDPLMDKEAIIDSWNKQLKICQEYNENTNRAKTLSNRQEWVEKSFFNIEAQQEKAIDRNKLTEKDKWSLALRRATDTRAIVSKNLLITEYLNDHLRAETFEDLSYKEAEERLQEQVKQDNIIELEKGYTSMDIIKSDREYRKHSLKEIEGFDLYSKKDADKFISDLNQDNLDSGRRALSEVQTAAAISILSADTRITIVQGDAGSGKTSMLKSVNEGLKEKDVEVVGIAMQGVAAKNLETETGIKSYTLTSYLARERKDGSASRVLVFDEASMLDTRNAAKLFKEAEKHNDRIILVGDKNQLESIGAGRVFDRLVTDYEKQAKLVSLYENYRQREKVLRDSVDLAKQGKMKESLQLLESNNRVHEISSDSDRRAVIAQKYNKDTLIITGTTNSKDEINIRIRQNLIDKKELDKKAEKLFTFARLDKSGTEMEYKINLTKGDKITFTKNDYKEFDIRNGERGEVLEVKDKFLQVRLEDKREILIDTDKYKNIDYGYAMTTYKAQGQTYNNVVVEADTANPSLNDMRNQYVNITRARDDVQIFTDDIKDLKDYAQVKTFAKDTFDTDRVFKLEDTLQDSLGAVKEEPPFIRNKHALEDKALNRAKLEETMNETNKCLNEDKDIPHVEKNMIRDFLNSKEAHQIWSSDCLTPNTIIKLAEIYFTPALKGSATYWMDEPQKKELNRVYNVIRPDLKDIVIRNEAVLKSYKGFPLEKQLEKEMELAAKTLTERKDLSHSDKLSVAKLLSSDQYVDVWHVSKHTDKSRIAVAEIVLNPEKKEKILQKFDAAQNEVIVKNTNNLTDSLNIVKLPKIL